MPYFVFLLVGMLAWRLYDQTLIWSTRHRGERVRLVEFAIYFGILLVSFATLFVADGEHYLQTGAAALSVASSRRSVAMALARVADGSSAAVRQTAATVPRQ